MAVMGERQKKGIKDEMGNEATPLPANKSSIELGTEIQWQLVGVVGKPVGGFKAQRLDQELVELPYMT